MLQYPVARSWSRSSDVGRRVFDFQAFKNLCILSVELCNSNERVFTMLDGGQSCLYFDFNYNRAGEPRGDIS